MIEPTNSNRDRATFPVDHSNRHCSVVVRKATSQADRHQPDVNYLSMLDSQANNRLDQHAIRYLFNMK